MSLAVTSETPTLSGNSLQPPPIKADGVMFELPCPWKARIHAPAYHADRALRLLDYLNSGLAEPQHELASMIREHDFQSANEITLKVPDSFRGARDGLSREIKFGLLSLLQRDPRSPVIDRSRKWTTAFNNNNSILYIEVGFGDGSALKKMALKRPDINFIGLDCDVNSVIRAAGKIGDIPNARIVFSADHVGFSDERQEACADVIYCRFPDPNCRYFFSHDEHGHDRADAALRVLKAGGSILVSPMVLEIESWRNHIELVFPEKDFIVREIGEDGRFSDLETVLENYEITIGGKIVIRTSVISRRS